MGADCDSDFWDGARMIHVHEVIHWKPSSDTG